MRFLSLLIAFSLVSCKSDRVDPAAGHALLDRYEASLRELGRSGSAEPMVPELDALAADGRALADKGAVPDAFRDRFARLLDVTRAVIAAPADEAARRANQETIDAFVRSVPGAAPPAPGGGLAAVAPALLEEILSLRMVLDGTSDREAARAKYAVRATP